MTVFEDEFEKSLNNPHDAAFKSAFEKITVAKSFFQTYFPERIARHIDFEHLEPGNKSYVDEKLREKHSDIIYRTKFKDSDAFLYILFEHQSTPDPVMVFRLLCYMVNIWKEHLDQNPEAKCLPVIFPAVLYHGKKKWNSPRTLGGLTDGDDDFSEYIPDFTYELYDLGDYPDEMLMLGEHMALSTVLYLLKHIYDKDFGKIFGQAMTMLAKIRDQSVFPEFLEWVLRYTYHARNEDDDKIREYIDRGTEKLGNESVRRATVTIAERIRKRGLEEGKTLLILKMLNKRFGMISPALEQNLRNSGADILDRFGESIFDFKEIKDAEKWWDTHGTEH